MSVYAPGQTAATDALFRDDNGDPVSPTGVTVSRYGPSGVVTAGATPIAQALGVNETYGAYSNPPTAWNTVHPAGIGWFCPISLAWEVL